MLRNTIITVSACLYVLLSVWLVGMQGKAYRDGLRRDLAAVSQAEEHAPPPPALKNDAPSAAVSENTATQSPVTPVVAAADPPATKQTHDQVNPPTRAKDKVQDEEIWTGGR